MKFVYRSMAIASLMMACSRGKDGTSTASEQQAEQAELLESILLEANTVADNVIIKGGTKQEGEPPVPNGAISLDVSSTSKMAFSGQGVDVSSSSDDKQLSLVLCSSIDKGTDGEGTQINQPCQGELVFSGEVEIDGNTLVIIEEDHKSFFQK